MTITSSHKAVKLPPASKVPRRTVAALKEQNTSHPRVTEGHCWACSVAHEINLGQILSVAEWGGSNLVAKDGSMPPETVALTSDSTLKSLDLLITEYSSWDLDVNYVAKTVGNRKNRGKRSNTHQTNSVADYRSVTDTSYETTNLSPRMYTAATTPVGMSHFLHCSQLVIEVATADVLFAWFKPDGHSIKYRLFIFSFGCLVVWDLPKAYRSKLIDFLKRSFIDPYNLVASPKEDATWLKMEYINEEAGLYSSETHSHNDSFHSEDLVFDEDVLYYIRETPNTKRVSRRITTCDNVEMIYEGSNNDKPNGLHHANTSRNSYSPRTGNISYPPTNQGEVVTDLPPNSEEHVIFRSEHYVMSDDDRMQMPSESFNYGKQFKPLVYGDIIYLKSEFVSEQLAYSYALAQSCKLAVFEAAIDQTIQTSKELPDSIAHRGRITADRAIVRKCIGNLFTTRFHVNLHSDILDTPEFFWENDSYESHYEFCRYYLDIPKRVTILNARLDVIKDMYDMLNQELLAENGIKLEWIVIYLVFAEVFIDVVWNIFIRDILKWV